ncbi:MAG TPA: GTP cyclohydrolase I FolE [Allosphingosinicella sp.]|jgi:GTP cyclohydrolase I
MYRIAPPQHVRTGTRPTAAAVENAVRTLLAATGDDPTREGLTETPARVRRAYEEWFAGYEIDPAAVLSKQFDAAGYGEAVVLRDIPLVSTCEHHLAPITGVVHIAYCPSGRVVGISKLVRLVDAFARRLQLQERLTNEIANAIDVALTPRGVGVVAEASHGCMTTRGVNTPHVRMSTHCWIGSLNDDADLRGRLLAPRGRPA